MLRGATFFLATGIGLIVLGSAELLPTLIRSPQGIVLAVLCISGGGGAVLYRVIRDYIRDNRAKQNMRGASTEAAQLIPILYGSYTPYVVEAAEKLGAARETTAVPALMHILDQTINTQPPDWCDTAEALVVALGKMGDRRALPLLHRLSNVRGIGILTVIHDAINRIEPETSLLRPGSADDLPREILLRPADACNESDPALLLRAGQESH